MGIVPARRDALVPDRQTNRALERIDRNAAIELFVADRVELVERAKVRALGSVAREAVREVDDIAAEVAACAERNPFGAQLAVRVATAAARELEHRVELTNRRLG